MQIVNAGLRFPRTRVRRTQTTAIVVHHLDAHWSVQRTHEFHNSLGWNGIGYNFHVAMDGTISEGRGLEFQGAHTNGFNSTTVGIGCEGRYHNVNSEMPDAQFDALVWLCNHLRGIYGEIPIRGHRDLNATACPGQFFPLDELRTLRIRGSNGTKNKEVMDVQEQIFNTLDEIPGWARSHVKTWMTTNDSTGQPVLRGDENGNLNLSLDMLRMITFIERRLSAGGISL